MDINIFSVLSAIKSGNGEELYNQLFNNNPQFRKFVEDNRGLTQEQMVNKYGVNIDDINKFLK